MIYQANPLNFQGIVPAYPNVYVHLPQISFPARYSVVNFQLEALSLRFLKIFSNISFSSTPSNLIIMEYLIFHTLATLLQKDFFDSHSQIYHGNTHNCFLAL